MPVPQGCPWPPRATCCSSTRREAFGHLRRSWVGHPKPLNGILSRGIVTLARPNRPCRRAPCRPGAARVTDGLAGAGRSPRGRATSHITRPACVLGAERSGGCARNALVPQSTGGRTSRRIHRPEPTPIPAESEDRRPDFLGRARTDIVTVGAPSDRAAESPFPKGARGRRSCCGGGRTSAGAPIDVHQILDVGSNQPSRSTRCAPVARLQRACSGPAWFSVPST